MLYLNILLFAIAAIAVTVFIIKKVEIQDDESAIRRAGRHGERIAAQAIEGVLRQGDYHLTNVSISYNGKRAELDNVIVNGNGVFIIEVKNYKGRLYGGENDSVWKKYKDDGYGNTFIKDVKNPVKQVERQAHILAEYLRGCCRVWVEGYVMLILNNCPVKSRYILERPEDIDMAIHSRGRNKLTKRQVLSIVQLLRQ